MYVRTYVCMYVCMDVCMYVRMCVCICMCVCMYILQGPMFVKPVSCQKKTVLFLELLDCAFAAAPCAAMHTASVKHLWWP